jgi:hypothetical protein
MQKKHDTIHVCLLLYRTGSSITTPYTAKYTNNSNTKVEGTDRTISQTSTIHMAYKAYSSVPCA